MDQLELLRYVIDVLERQAIAYMVVGSYASGVYGEPRLTQDIDIVVNLRAEQVGLLVGAFPSDEFYVSPDAAREAVRNGGQFNVIHPDSGYKIDFMIARRDAWGIEQLARRQRQPLLSDREGFAARPEDIILSKLLYFEEGGSEKHLRDIAGMLRVSGPAVDRDYVEKWAGQLGVTHVWHIVLKRAIGSSGGEQA